jgi:hypothetical protein
MQIRFDTPHVLLDSLPMLPSHLLNNCSHADSSIQNGRTCLDRRERSQWGFPPGELARPATEGKTWPAKEARKQRTMPLN